MFPPSIHAALVGHLPDDVEVWRAPSASTPSTLDGFDGFGFPVSTGSGAGSNAPTKRAEMRGELANAAKFKAGGAQANVSEQVLAIAQWVISVPESPLLDVKIGDELRIGARRFPVLFPGAADSHCPLRLVWCQEIL